MTLEDHLNKSTLLADQDKIRESLEQLRCAITLAAGGGPSIKVCRDTLWRAMEADPGWRASWVANIACVIMDFENSLNRALGPDARSPFSTDARDALAELIIDCIFKP